MFARRPKRLTLPIRVHFTPSGYLTLGCVLMVGLAASRTQAPLTFVLFGAMLGALVVSWVLAWRALSPVQLEREMPDRLWQDQPTFFSYVLRSRRGQSSLGLRIREQPQEALELAGAYCLHLEHGTTFRSGTRLAARQRGLLDLQDIQLSTIFPFGLIRATKVFRRPMRLVVWPARGCLRRQLLRKGAAESSSIRPSSIQGGQDEFFGLRDYRAGDSPRWIHWRRTARLGRPVVMEMTRPLPEVVWIIVDALAAPGDRDGAHRERRLRMAATLVDHAFGGDYKIGLATGGSGGGVQVVPPATGLGHRSRLLDTLAVVSDGGAEPFDAALRQLRPSWLRWAQVIVITDDRSRLAGGGWQRLGSACRAVTVIDRSAMDEVFQDAATCALGEDPICR